MEADIQQRATDKAAAKALRDSDGLTPQARLMRKRRTRPDIKAAERKAIRARDTAMRTLAKKHPEEFMVYVQDERKKLGLEPLQPRGKHRTTLEERAHTKEQAATPQQPAASSEQANCVHGNYPMKKLSYGKFCGNCGKRIT